MWWTLCISVMWDRCQPVPHLRSSWNQWSRHSERGTRIWDPKLWTSLAHPFFVWGSREAWQLNAHFFLAARGLLLASPLCHHRCTSGGRSIQLLDWQLEGLKHDHEPDRFLVTTNWMAPIFRPGFFLMFMSVFLNNKLVETSEIQNPTQRNFALKLN